MGGGKGGGGGEIPKEIQATAQTLRDIGVKQFDLGMPLIETGAGQAQELLKTGNVGALGPAIRSAVEGTRSAQSAGLRNTMESATQQGLTGTALQEALAGARIGAESTVAGVPAQFLTPFLSQMAGPAFGLPEQGLGAIGQAGQIGGISAGPGRSGGGAGSVLGSAAGAAATGLAVGGPVGAGVGALMFASGLMGQK